MLASNSNPRSKTALLALPQTNASISVPSVFLAVIACPMPSLVLIEPTQIVFHHQLIIRPVTLAHQFA